MRPKVQSDCPRSPSKLVAEGSVALASGLCLFTNLPLFIALELGILGKGTAGKFNDLMQTLPRICFLLVSKGCRKKGGRKFKVRVL